MQLPALSDASAAPRVHTPIRALATALLAVAVAFAPLWPAAAQAQAESDSVTVLSPVALEPAAARLTPLFGQALQNALARPGPYHALNVTAVPPEELVPMFGCARVDVACARRAGQAAGSALVLYSEIGWEGEGVVTRLTLVNVADGVTHRQGAWFVHPVPSADAPGLKRALDAIGHLFLVQRTSVPILINATGGPVDVEGRSVAAGEVRILSPGQARVTRAGHPDRAVELAAGEIVLIADDAKGNDLLGGPSPTRQTAAWVTLGVGAAATVAAGVLAWQLGATQEAYDSAATANDLRTLADRGGTEATATNVLLVGGVLLLGTAAWLAWGP